MERQYQDISIFINELEKFLCRTVYDVGDGYLDAGYLKEEYDICKMHLKRICDYGYDAWIYTSKHKSPNRNIRISLHEKKTYST